ncbi:DUF4858 domain-containing protein [Parabacteroides sp. OttesenSCG-928-G07]|nr:DUF4858 domain-containing protein [Parabacteroides sp. OttesenSCG-928-G07]
MNKQLLIFLFICLKGTGVAYGQWTPSDSLWLQNILLGKDSLRLNPETMRAIQNGTFLNSETPKTPLQISPIETLIIKDFSEYVDKNGEREIALKDLPPGAFMRIPVEAPKPPYKIRMDILLRKPKSPEGPNPSGGGGYDFNHALSMLFSAKYRQFDKNAKNAKRLKNYNSNPMLTVPKEKKKTYKEREKDLPLPTVTRHDSVKKTATNQSSAAPDSAILVVEGDSLLNKMLPK